MFPNFTLSIPLIFIFFKNILHFTLPHQSHIHRETSVKFFEHLCLFKNRFYIPITLEQYHGTILDKAYYILLPPPLKNVMFLKNINI